MQVSFDVVKETLASLLPEMQPRWVKGMATVISTYAVVSTPAKYSTSAFVINLLYLPKKVTVFSMTVWDSQHDTCHIICISIQPDTTSFKVFKVHIRYF